MEESVSGRSEAVFTVDPGTMAIVKDTCPVLCDDSSGLCPVETTPVFTDPETRSVKQIKEVTKSASSSQSRDRRRGSRISIKFRSTQTNTTPTMNAKSTGDTSNSRGHFRSCCCSCCAMRITKTTRFVLIRVFLTGLLVAYIVVGAVLFFFLESPVETVQHEEFTKWKNDTAILLATELRQVKPYEDVWIRTVYQYLDSFERDVLQVCHQGYKRNDEHGTSRMWTLNSAFFFSVSVLTTTGYVGVTLQSAWARVALLVYSAFGIPMMVSWLAAIGAALANLWTWIYKRVCCAVYINRKRKVEPSHVPTDNNQYSTASQEYAEQLQTNLATPLLPPPNSGAGSGMLTNRAFSADNSGALHGSSSSLPVQEIQQAELIQDAISPGGGMAANTTTQHQQTDQLQRYSPTVEDFVLPTLLSLFIFLMYFIFGSAMVSVQEDWTLVDSAYFVYLHFTTLGVSSFQPTPTSKTSYYGSPSTIKHDVLFVIYLLFGYCLLSMILCLIFRFVCDKRKRKHFGSTSEVPTNSCADYCNGVSTSGPPGAGDIRT